MRKICALLVLSMLLLTACSRNSGNGESTPTPEEAVTAAPSETPVSPTETPEPTEAPPTPIPATDPSLVRDPDGVIFAGVVDTQEKSPEKTDGGVYAGVAGRDYTDTRSYTYEDYVRSLEGLTWSPMALATEDDRKIYGYISAGLYDYVLNAAGDGRSVLCEMAAALPVDVTAEYAGRYGIQPGDKGRVWKIALNPAAVWDDGTEIDAESYIYSYRELLDPKMEFPMAQSVIEGAFAISGAREYYYSEKTVWVANSDGKTPATAWTDIAKNDDGQYTSPDGTELYFGLRTPYEWLFGSTLEQYKDYFPSDTYKTLEKLADKEGYVPVTDKSIAALAKFTGSDAWGNETENELAHYVSMKKEYPQTPWEDVGIFKTGRYTLLIVTEKAVEGTVELPGLLRSVCLVNKKLWESSKVYLDAKGNEVEKDSEDVESIRSVYGTSPETSASFGPYKMAEVGEDSVRLVRNEKWYGYHDEAHGGQYQTDAILCRVLKDYNEELTAFLSGELDTVTLQTQEAAKYRNSRYLRIVPQTYSTKLTLNINPESLEGRGTQILANENFRRALSLAIDRGKFAEAFSASGTPGLGLWNDSVACDRLYAEPYRDTDAAKEAIVGLYGIRYGEGEAFATVSEAYASITGYDPEAAREYLRKAYEECVAAGIYDEESEIKIELSVYGKDEIYGKMVEFIDAALQQIAEGTELEGRISVVTKVDADYYDSMYAGKADMIFSSWSCGSNGFFSYLYDLYCDDAAGKGKQLEYGYDTSKIFVKIRVDGKNYVESLQDWAIWAARINPDCKIAATDGSGTLGGFGTYDIGAQTKIYALLEKVWLSAYASIPLYHRNTPVLVSQKGDFAGTRYVDEVGFGGIRFYVHRYDDTEWSNLAPALQYE